MMISIVIPVFNEAEGVASLVERLKDVRSALVPHDVEVILVDDHSTDETPQLLMRACEEDAKLRYLRLARNSGSHVAILAGIEHARGNCVVFLAADLQDPPELIPRMIESWQAGHHVVWAVREEREGIGWFERMTARMFYWLLQHVGMIKMPPQGADFALLDAGVAKALIASVGANPSLGGEIVRLGFRQAHIPYTKEPRRFGRSKWTLEKKLRAFADAFVAFSYVPLRFMSYLGLLLSVLGFLYAAIVIIMRLFSDQPIQGWASTVVIVLVLGGVQMTMLGVLGEYLWRTLEAARRRPRYHIEEESGLAGETKVDRHDDSSGCRVETVRRDVCEPRAH